MGAFDRDYAFGADAKPTQYVAPPAHVQGIVRKDGPNAGRVATRNYIGILSTVNCSATVARGIADHFTRERLAAFPERRRRGGAHARLGLRHGHARRGHADPAAHARRLRPASELRRRADDRARLRVEPDQLAAAVPSQLAGRARCCSTFSIQDTGGTAKTIAHGIAIDRGDAAARQRRRRASPCRRRTSPSACSAAAPTATPASPPTRRSGAAVDLLVRHGGTAILSETPEIYGAEHLLTRRAVSREVGEKLVARIKWWEEYTEREKGEMNNNPVAGQQGGRAHDHPREVARRRRQGRHHQPGRRVRVRRSPSRPRASCTWTRPGYDPVSATGPGRRRREHDRLHHRPRLGLRLRAVAVAQALDQHRALGAAGRGHRPQLRRDRRRQRERRGDRRERSSS